MFRNVLVAALVILPSLECYAQGAAIGPDPRFSESECARHLTETREVGSYAYDRAAHVIAWLSFTHPIWRRAIAAANDFQTQADLIHLPLGYTVMPSSDTFRDPRRSSLLAFVHALNSIAVIPDRDDAPTLMKSEVTRIKGTAEWIKNSWNSGHSPKVKITQVAEVLGYAAMMLRQINRGEPWSDVGALYPKLNFEIKYQSPAKTDLRLRLDWLRSFSKEDRESLRFIYWSFDGEDVRWLVTRWFHQFADQVVTFHDRLCEELDRCKTSEGFTQNIAKLTAPSLHDPIDSRLQKAFEDLVPPPPSAVPMAIEAAPPAPTSGPATEIHNFVRANGLARLGRADLLEAYRGLQRAGALVNQVLAGLSQVNVVKWTDFASQIEAGVTVPGGLSETLKTENDESERAFTSLGEAEASLGQLRDWGRARIAALDEFNTNDDEVNNLSRYERELLTTSLKAVQEFWTLNERSIEAIRLRRRVTLSRAEASAAVRLSLGDALAEQLRAGTADLAARRVLIDSLKRRAELDVRGAVAEIGVGE